MIRFFCALFKIPYETCKSCHTLEKQLEYEVAKNKELTETLISILKPKTYEAAPVELNQVTQVAGTFARRRAALEEAERLRARTLRDSQFVAKAKDDKSDKVEVLGINKASNSIEQLEQELGVEEKHG